MRHSFLLRLGRFATNIGEFHGKVLGDITALDSAIAKDIEFKCISLCRRTIDTSNYHTLFRVEDVCGDSGYNISGYNTEFDRLFLAGNRNIVFSYECVE